MKPIAWVGSEKKLCALLPGLSKEGGHIYPYHLSMQQAVQKFGWKYEAFIPRLAAIKPLPVQWHRVLANDFWDRPKSLFFRLKMLVANITPFYSIFRREKDQERTIFFLEHFELQNLASIVLALFFIRAVFQFWILHRFAYGKNHFKTRIYRFFHRFLEWKLGKERVRFLTDSDLLAAVHRDVFSRPIRVVSIPHTAVGEKILGCERRPLLWWPGGVMNESRGLCVVQTLAQALSSQKRFQLLLAEKGKTIFSEASLGALRFLPDHLSQEQYIRWMRTVDLVLLPYSPRDYAYRTSGIFVEAICLGSIPVVSRGTWMAYELSKYNLSELALSEEEFVMPERLAAFLNDAELLRKLDAMRAVYREFHSEEGFARVLQEIATTHS